MKESILEAAAKEIELHGSSFRMDDLAKRMNISKRTLYENFRSKNEIIEQIMEEWADSFYTQHRSILMDKSLTVEEALYKHFSVRSTLYETLNAGHFKEMFESMPYLRDQIMDIFSKDWNLLEDYLHEKQDQGYLRKDVNVSIIILMIQGLVRYVLHDKKEDPDRFYELMPEALQMLFEGILEREK